jgi:transcriptional regulator with XRE-family HTH domain
VSESLELVVMRLSVRLRELRLGAGLTQAQLAARAEVTVETVARLERAVRDRASANGNPSLGTLIMLANALDVPVIELLSAPIEEPAPPRGHKTRKK